jgi:hypothetical protein
MAPPSVIVMSNQQAAPVRADVVDPAARARSLLFSTALGGSVSGAATKVLAEGIDAWHPASGAVAKRLIAPAAIAGGIAGYMDRSADIQRATDKLKSDQQRSLMLAAMAAHHPATKRAPVTVIHTAPPTPDIAVSPTALRAQHAPSGASFAKEGADWGHVARTVGGHALAGAASGGLSGAVMGAAGNFAAAPEHRLGYADAARQGALRGAILGGATGLASGGIAAHHHTKTQNRLAELETALRPLEERVAAHKTFADAASSLHADSVNRLHDANRAQSKAKADLDHSTWGMVGHPFNEAFKNHPELDAAWKANPVHQYEWLEMSPQAQRDAANKFYTGLDSTFDRVVPDAANLRTSYEQASRQHADVYQASHAARNAQRQAVDAMEKSRSLLDRANNHLAEVSRDRDQVANNIHTTTSKGDAFQRRALATGVLGGGAFLGGSAGWVNGKVGNPATYHDPTPEELNAAKTASLRIGTLDAIPMSGLAVLRAEFPGRSDAELLAAHQMSRYMAMQEARDSMGRLVRPHEELSIDYGDHLHAAAPEAAPSAPAPHGGFGGAGRSGSVGAEKAGEDPASLRERLTEGFNTPEERADTSKRFIVGGLAGVGGKYLRDKVMDLGARYRRNGGDVAQYNRAITGGNSPLSVPFKNVGDVANALGVTDHNSINYHLDDAFSGGDRVHMSLERLGGLRPGRPVDVHLNPTGYTQGFTDQTVSLSSLAHELGHVRNQQTNGLKFLGTAAAERMGNMARHGIMGHAVLSGDDGDSSKDWRYAAGVLGTHLPTLIDEGMASYHGLAGLRRAGIAPDMHRLSRNDLLRAFGTYAAHAGGDALGTYAARKLTRVGTRLVNTGSPFRPAAATAAPDNSATPAAPADAPSTPAKAASDGIKLQEAPSMGSDDAYMKRRRESDRVEKLVPVAANEIIDRIRRAVGSADAANIRPEVAVADELRTPPMEQELPDNLASVAPAFRTYGNFRDQLDAQLQGFETGKLVQHKYRASTVLPGDARLVGLTEPTIASRKDRWSRDADVDWSSDRAKGV